MSASSRKPGWTAAGILGAVALGIIGAPPTFVEPIRLAVHDGLRPGQRALQLTTDWVKAHTLTRGPVTDHENEMAALREEVRHWRHRARRLETLAAGLREQLDAVQQHGAAPVQGVPGKPLILPELLEAAVLGEETARQWQAGRFIDRGRIDGVSESEFVLDASTRIIDQGSDTNVAPGQPVYAGKCVVGRISQAGRWTSTVQLVTDEEYRGFAQLVRKTSSGFVFGARGILEGRGERLCRLKFVRSTEAVDIGDEVYTGNRDGVLPSPLYYGTVVRAELDPGAPHWTIWVKPAVVDLELQTVQVLRTKINPARVPRRIEPQTR